MKILTAAMLVAFAFPALADTVVVPGSVNIITLDVKAIAVGSTAVVALAAGNARRGGFVVTSNAAGLCVNLVGTAGVASSGDTVCVAQNVIFNIPPTYGPVSVNSTATAAIAGYGYN
jgi:hypothetical protein